MNSQLVVIALVVLCGALSVNSSAFKAYSQTIADQSLMNVLIKSRSSGSNQMKCFLHYNPILKKHADEFQEAFNLCEKIANNQTSALAEWGTESRNNITSLSNEICSEFLDCQNEASNLDFLDCYSNLGDSSVRKVYANSQNASVAASELREGLHKIEFDRSRCEDKAEAAYVEKTADTYQRLLDCLDGGINWTDAPPTDAPSTEAPATEAPATEVPATEAPATEAPATEAPATEAPATEAPATEAPATEAPATEAPATDAPATEAPATEAPATDAPATEAPDSEPDQIEELKLNSVRGQLQSLVNDWRKRFA